MFSTTAGCGAYESGGGGGGGVGWGWQGKSPVVNLKGGSLWQMIAYERMVARKTSTVEVFFYRATIESICII